MVRILFLSVSLVLSAGCAVGRATDGSIHSSDVQKVLNAYKTQRDETVTHLKNCETRIAYYQELEANPKSSGRHIARVEDYSHLAQAEMDLLQRYESRKDVLDHVISDLETVLSGR